VNDILVLVELSDILKDKFVQIVFHVVDFNLELGDLWFEDAVLVLFVLVLLLGLSDFNLKILLFFLKRFSLLLELLRLILEVSKNCLLLLAESLMDEALLSLHALNLVEVDLKSFALLLDITNHFFYHSLLSSSLFQRSFFVPFQKRLRYSPHHTRLDSVHSKSWR